MCITIIDIHNFDFDCRQTISSFRRGKFITHNYYSNCFPLKLIRLYKLLIAIQTIGAYNTVGFVNVMWCECQLIWSNLTRRKNWRKTVYCSISVPNEEYLHFLADYVYGNNMDTTQISVHMRDLIGCQTDYNEWIWLGIDETETWKLMTSSHIEICHKCSLWKMKVWKVWRLLNKDSVYHMVCKQRVWWHCIRCIMFGARYFSSFTENNYKI